MGWKIGEHERRELQVDFSAVCLYECFVSLYVYACARLRDACVRGVFLSSSLPPPLPPSLPPFLPPPPPSSSLSLPLSLPPPPRSPLPAPPTFSFTCACACARLQPITHTRTRAHTQQSFALADIQNSNEESRYHILECRSTITRSCTTSVPQPPTPPRPHNGEGGSRVPLSLASGIIRT
jgi:hypothetical protein